MIVHCRLMRLEAVRDAETKAAAALATAEQTVERQAACAMFPVSVRNTLITPITLRCLKDASDFQGRLVPSNAITRVSLMWLRGFQNETDNTGQAAEIAELQSQHSAVHAVEKAMMLAVIDIYKDKSSCFDGCRANHGATGNRNCRAAITTIDNARNEGLITRGYFSLL